MTNKPDEPKIITIMQLYPKDMNIYGDTGNLLVLKKRLEWYGFTPQVVSYNVGDMLPKKPDIIIGGGGQDSGQQRIYKDLQKIKYYLKEWASLGVPMLMVCGLYQLFGKSFTTLEGEKLNGIGIFDMETIGTNKRLIGNIVTTCPEFGEIIGYENHSGQTYLSNDTTPLATVLTGEGNNQTDTSEGARYKNVIGTYLHGSILPKNPKVADYLIKQATINKYGQFLPKTKINDGFSAKARKIAKSRPR